MCVASIANFPRTALPQGKRGMSVHGTWTRTTPVSTMPHGLGSMPRVDFIPRQEPELGRGRCPPRRPSQNHGDPRGTEPPGARHRVRRYRHEPALHAQDRPRPDRRRIPTPSAILGSLSLMVWTLFIVTTVKYVGLAMRIDNDGEGGILALMSLLGVEAASSGPLIVAGGPVRRGADLWRRRDHAGDLGAVRARRARTSRRRRSTPTCCRLRSSILVAAVRRAAAGHRAHRRGLRPDHAAVVRRRSPLLGIWGIAAASGGAARAQSALRPALSRRRRADAAFWCWAACSSA